MVFDAQGRAVDGASVVLVRVPIGTPPGLPATVALSRSPGPR